jgi:short-subunit dehydrogenase
VEKILITGCSSGFGKALLKNLSKEYFIICISRRIPTIKKKIIEFYKFDISISFSLIKCLNKIKKKHKYRPYIINNAGIFKICNLEDIKLINIIKFFKINSFAPTIITKKLISEMKKNNFGRIINITSGAPLNCAPGGFLYSGSKSALNVLTLTTSNECKGFNIKANLFSPGQIKTEMMPKAKGDPNKAVKFIKILLSKRKTLFSGKFIWRNYNLPLNVNLKNINWANGTAPMKYKIKKKYD